MQLQWRPEELGWWVQFRHLRLPFLVLSEGMERNWRRADNFQQQYIWILLSDGIPETGKRMFLYPISIGHIYLPTIAKLGNRSWWYAVRIELFSFDLRICLAIIDTL